MLIQYKQKFILHTRHPGDVEHLGIRLRVTIRGKRPLDVPTGCYVDKCLWDEEKGRIRRENGQICDANRLLDAWQNIVDEIMARFELVEKRIPDIGEFRDLFNDMAGRPTRITRILDDMNPDFFGAFRLFTNEQGAQNQWTDATHEKFHALEQHLKSFDPLLNWETLNERKLQSYVQHLLDGGMVNTTLAKHLAFLRWFLRWCNTRGYYHGKLHETFKPRLKGVGDESREIIYLERDELDAIMNHTFPPSEPGLERVRDVFLFCCFTGLRYSDVAKLRRSDIHDGSISVMTQKTRDALHIELNKHSMAILTKYAGQTFSRGRINDLALPVISNVKMNAALKRIGIECGLNRPTRVTYFQGNKRIEQEMPKWQLLTTHVARRTFVVTALRLGIAPAVIMKWTGHSDYKAMKPYIAIVDELKRKSMSRFDDL